MGPAISELKPTPFVAYTVGDNLVQANKGTAADEQNIGGVDLQKLLLRVLAAAGRRNARDSALEDLQERLLHALAGDIARDGEVFRLASNLVDLVHVDDADLRAVDVTIRGVDKLEQDVLNVLTNVARLGQRRGVGNREGHLEDASERLRQQGLTGTGGTKKQDVALGELHALEIVRIVGMLAKRAGRRGISLSGGTFQNATVVVVNGNGHGALGVFLAHDVLGKLVIDLMRRGHAADEAGCDLGSGGILFLDFELAHCVLHGRHAVGSSHEILCQRLLENLRACGNAFIADKGIGGTLYQLADLILRLTAEGAADDAVIMRIVIIGRHA